MRFPQLRFCALALVLTSVRLFAQASASPVETASVDPVPPPQFSTSTAGHKERMPDMQTEQTSYRSEFDRSYHFGVLAQFGAAGLGIQFGMPVSRHLAIRAGGDFMRYNFAFQQDQANVSGKLQLGYARLTADYFPWAQHRFHISPLLVVANQSHMQANVAIPADENLSLEGQTFRSTTTDPLHGMGRVDFNRLAPGMTLGFGNITHGRGHWTFPVEMGFFYNGQPKLAINFSGTACMVGVPAQYGCMKVQDQADFQADLKKFRARQENNLSYARYIPVANLGMGYRF